MPLIVAVDIGTSKLCALVVDAASGEPVGAPVTYANDAGLPDLAPGRHEQDPSRIAEACDGLVAAVVRTLGPARDDVVALALSGQMHGVLLADRATLRPLHPLVTWQDERVLEPRGSGLPDKRVLEPQGPRRPDERVLEPRGSGLPDERVLEAQDRGRLDDALSLAERQEAAGRTGCVLAAGYGGATLHWLAAHGARVPGALASGAVALSIADYVAARWTGRAASEPTHAASWGLLDLSACSGNGSQHVAQPPSAVKASEIGKSTATGLTAEGDCATRSCTLPVDWDAPLIERLGLPREVLPELVPTASVLGTLRPEAAQALGLPARTVVCAPVGDNQASVVGTVGFALDAAVLNLGTGGQISLPTAGFIRPPGLETRPMPGGGFLLVGASLCGGWSYTYLCQFFRQVAEAVGGAPVGEAAAYERLNALAAAAPDGADGLRADTRFRGTRADASLRGALTGIGAANLTPGGVARAFLEGMVRELAGMIRQPGIPPPREVYASGNAVRRNPLVAALIEREFGAPCRLAPAREEAAVGAARCVVKTLGF